MPATRELAEYLAAFDPDALPERVIRYRLPDLEDCIEANLTAARLTNPDVRLLGFSLNTARLDEAGAARALGEVERRFGLPAVDPLRTGVGRLVDAIG